MDRKINNKNNEERRENQEWEEIQCEERRVCMMYIEIKIPIKSTEKNGGRLLMGGT